MTEGLNEKLRSIEEEKTEFEECISKIRKKVEEDDERDYVTYLETEQIREQCISVDAKILQLLEDRQELLNCIRKHRRELLDEFRREIKKGYTEFAAREEDIYYQMQNCECNRDE